MVITPEVTWVKMCGSVCFLDLIGGGMGDKEWWGGLI